MGGRATYRRVVSAEEAREGYVLVEKARLRSFPPEGEAFRLEGRETTVESYGCACRGPERPHRHWFLRLGGLTPGAVVEIVREADGAYALRRS
jgi:hypothetical protein